MGNGVSKENAAIIAKCLIQADLRGVESHGINRIPSYMDRIRQDVLDPKVTPSLTKITPVVAQVSGHWQFLTDHVTQLIILPGRWAQWLWVPSGPPRHHSGHRHGKRIRHWHGIGQALKSFWDVCLARARSPRRGNDELGIHKLLACPPGVGRDVKANGCLPNCVWGSGWKRTAVYLRYGPVSRSPG
jgi:hypothetical protein